MKNFLLCLFLCGAMAAVLIIPVYEAAAQGVTPETPAVQEAVAALRTLYATDVILGKPLEVGQYTVIPLATVGMGYGQRDGAQGQRPMQGAGGVLSPVGVLVISPQGVQMLPVAKGVVEQVLGAVTPVLLQQFRGAEAQGRPGGAPRPTLTAADILLALYGLLPAQGWRFGAFPWPLPLVLLFVVGWLGLALLLTAFLPRQVTAVAGVLAARTLQAGLLGLGGYIVVFLLVVVFTLSLVGLPLGLVLLGLTWAGALFGTVSLAWLVGRRCLLALQRAPATDMLYVLLGGGLLGIIRLIPFLGWIVWFIVGVFGFGALLLTLRNTVRAPGTAPGV